MARIRGWASRVHRVGRSGRGDDEGSATGRSTGCWRDAVDGAVGVRRVRLREQTCAVNRGNVYRIHAEVMRFAGLDLVESIIFLGPPAISISYEKIVARVRIYCLQVL